MQTEPPPHRRKYGRIISLAVIAILLLTAIGTFWFRGEPFDGSKWNDEARMRDNGRSRMADRLLARRSLRGKTKNEVLALLGIPRATEYFRDWDLVYWLGSERGFISIDSEWLVLKFNSEGRVSDAKIVTD